MQILKNNTEVNMMILEVNLNKRKSNPIIGFIASNTQEINAGDTILVDKINSRYSIEAIVSKKPSAFKNKTYYTAKATYIQH